MLTEHDLHNALRAAGLNSDGIEYLLDARSAPARRVRADSRKRNVTRLFASQRMGRVIQAESSTVELPFVLDCEYDESVLEYWDQPPTLPIVMINRRGRPHRSTYTPDYIVVRQGDGYSVCVYQCKARDEVERLCKEQPQNWVHCDGEYSYLPADQALSELGIRHKVYVPEDYAPLRSRNIKLLLQVASQPVDERDLGLARRIRRALQAADCFTLASLMSKLSLSDTSPLLRLISSGVIQTNINRFNLSCESDAIVSLSAEAVSDYLESRQVLSPDAIDGPSPTDAVRIVDRLRQIADPSSRTASPRTIRRWKKELKDANGDPRGLASSIHKRGNRHRKLRKLQIRVALRHIARYFMTAHAPSNTQAHSNYLLQHQKLCCRIKPGAPVSKSTYDRLIANLDREGVELARGGIRAANQVHVPVRSGVRNEPVERPFEEAHADHFLLNVFVKVKASGGKVYYQKPWLSVLRDSWSGAVLAFTLGLQSPSKRACARLLRDCVQRHGRVPECIIVDGGADFRSGYFEYTLASLGIDKGERPGSAPRFGGPIENLFAKTKLYFDWRVPGSNKNNYRNRSASRSHKGQSTARLSLIDIYREVEFTLFELLNRYSFGCSDDAPAIRLSAKLAIYSMSGHQHVFDETFKLRTAIEAPKPLYRLNPSRGIHLGTSHYWNDALRDVKTKRSIDVLIDPWDDGFIYARVGDRWVVCDATSHSRRAVREPTTRMCECTLRLDGREAHKTAATEADQKLADFHAARNKRLEQQHDEDTTAAPPSPESDQAAKHRRPATPIPFSYLEDVTNAS